jgi:hypothetical protein
VGGWWRGQERTNRTLVAFMEKWTPSRRRNNVTGREGRTALEARLIPSPPTRPASTERVRHRATEPANRSTRTIHSIAPSTVNCQTVQNTQRATRRRLDKGSHSDSSRLGLLDQGILLSGRKGFTRTDGIEAGRDLCPRSRSPPPSLRPTATSLLRAPIPEF